MSDPLDTPSSTEPPEVIDVSDASVAPTESVEVGDVSATAPEAVDSGTDHHEVAAVDLDAVERDLSDVEAALNRLADGTYWTDEVTGDPLPEAILADNPLARRA